MTIQLNKPDFDRLVDILMPALSHVQAREALLMDVFVGSPRQADIVSQIEIDGTRRQVAVKLIYTLCKFGQDKPGRETLGILIDWLLEMRGGGEESDFLQGLFAQYPLKR